MTDSSGNPFDPNDPNFEFVLDPNDPNYFKKINDSIRSKVNTQEIENMKAQALSNAIDSWIAGMLPRDIANLYFLLCVLNPHANSKKTVIFMASKYQGRLEQKMSDLGMNSSIEELIRYILEMD